MSKQLLYALGVLAFLSMITLSFSGTNTVNVEISEKVKISLRKVGHDLLIANKDSTSLVLPISEIGPSKYRLSFENHLSMDPSKLVAAIEKSFKEIQLPVNYRVEVIQCTDGEVAYSYEMSVGVEQTLLPCRGRLLPENCYEIELRFMDTTQRFTGTPTPFYLWLLLGLTLIGFIYYKSKMSADATKVETIVEGANSFDIGPYETIGSYKFYPEQNKLVKETVEISLSKKECELLAIFAAQPNQIIKRDELTKRVWEDNGVFVGRSLDTYISKLRKKLKDDTSIKLTNVHGVGYKLEVVRG